MKNWILSLLFESRGGLEYIHGRFVVMYPDGRRSQRMWLETAENYQQIFGGTIIFVKKFGKR